jgi:hypothetical protein
MNMPVGITLVVKFLTTAKFFRHSTALSSILTLAGGCERPTFWSDITIMAVRTLIRPPGCELLKHFPNAEIRNLMQALLQAGAVGQALFVGQNPY